MIWFMFMLLYRSPIGELKKIVFFINLTWVNIYWEEMNTSCLEIRLTLLWFSEIRLLHCFHKMIICSYLFTVWVCMWEQNIQRKKINKKDLVSPISCVIDWRNINEFNCDWFLKEIQNHNLSLARFASLYKV